MGRERERERETDRQTDREREQGRERSTCEFAKGISLFNNKHIIMRQTHARKDLGKVHAGRMIASDPSLLVVHILVQKGRTNGKKQITAVIWNETHFSSGTGKVTGSNLEMYKQNVLKVSVSLCSVDQTIPAYTH